MAHLYIDETLTDVTIGSTITVVGDEARHAVKVSRLRETERITVTNGRGLLVSGAVTRTESSAFHMTAEEVLRHEPPATRIWIVQALAKGDRAERAVELATEFGAAGFLPWQAERSVSRWDPPKALKGRDKWQRVAREAAKQSLRAYIPEVRELITTNELCDLAGHDAVSVYVLHPRHARPLSEVVAESRASEIYICVGPEGGFTDTELDALEQAGAHIATIGQEVLRTSSAGAAGLAVVNLAQGRW